MCHIFGVWFMQKQQQIFKIFIFVLQRMESCITCVKFASYNNNNNRGCAQILPNPNSQNIWNSSNKAT